MVSEKIMVPGLFPVQTTETEKGYTATVWNRTYTIDKAPLFSSIVSAGEEILASPMRVVCENNGKPIVLGDCLNFRMEQLSQKSITFAQTADLDEYFFGSSMTIYYDGCVKGDIKFSPKVGKKRGPNNVWSYPTEALCLNKCWLEIPLKKEYAKYYNVWPSCTGTYKEDKIVYPGFVKDDKIIYDEHQFSYNALGTIPEKNICFPFKHSIFVGGDDIGFSMFFESDEGWTPNDELHVIECHQQEDCLLLRIRFLDSEHPSWLEKDPWKGCLRHPIVFSFGMIATPVKPFPENQFDEKSFHDVGIKYQPNGIDWDYTFFKPLHNSNDNMNMIDRLKESGVNVVYIHEAWNDTQNGFILTDKSVERLKTLVDAGHERGIKVVPYMSGELGSFSPLLDSKYLNYRLLPPEIYFDDSRFTRNPMHNAIHICYNTELKQKFLDTARHLMDDFGADGVYLDGVYSVPACSNYLHGCGYKDKKGKLHPTFPIWNLREMTEELFEIVESRGGIIHTHTFNAFPAPLAAFTHRLWDGEPIQHNFAAGDFDEMPEHHLRCLYSGKALGVPVNMIAYHYPNKWSFKDTMAFTIALGILPKPQWHEDLRVISQVWKAYDSVPLANAPFYPYYKNDVKVSYDKVKISYFDYGKGILAIVANAKKCSSGKVDITFNNSFASATEKLSGENYTLQNGNTITVEFDGLDFKIFDLKK